MFADYKVVIGYAPTRRDMFPDKKEAQKVEPKVKKRVWDIIENLDNVEIVGLEWLNDEGMIYDVNDARIVADYFISKKVDAVFMPHCNFGQEEAVAKLGKIMNKPFLLWGPRDEAPLENFAQRQTDSQCGLFASSKALMRYQVPFTYIENCWIEDEALEKGISEFVRIATVVKKMRNLRIGQISIRPRQFLSVISNESELLEKFGIEIVPINSVEILSLFRTNLEGKLEKTKSIVDEMKQTMDTSLMDDEAIEKIACLEVTIMQLEEKYNLDALASECWTMYTKEIGVAGCFAFGDLSEKGLPVACEADILGAISSVFLSACARGETPNFLADITIRHPENENAELLWHCGPFPKSLAKYPEERKLVECKGFWELKGGDVTVLRFDGCLGKYNLFVGEAKGIEGPSTNGNYLWIETDNWLEWERRLIYGPYVHHIAGIHGKYKSVIEEACRYLPKITKDFM